MGRSCDSSTDRVRSMHANGQHTGSGNRVPFSRHGRHYDAGVHVSYACGHHGAIATKNCANISADIDDTDTPVISSKRADHRTNLQSERSTSTRGRHGRKVP